MDNVLKSKLSCQLNPHKKVVTSKGQLFCRIEYSHLYSWVIGYILDNNTQPCIITDSYICYSYCDTPYSGNVWLGVSLVNHQRFAKLKLSKLIVTINKLLADLLIHQTFFTEIFIHPLLSNIITTKLSCGMVTSYNLMSSQHNSTGNYIVYNYCESQAKSEHSSSHPRP